MAKEKYPQVGQKLDQQIAGYLGNNEDVDRAGLGFTMHDETRRGIEAHVRVAVGQRPGHIIEVGYTPSQFPDYGWKRLRPLRNAIKYALTQKGLEKFEEASRKVFFSTLRCSAPLRFRKFLISFVCHIDLLF